jgi:S-adenosylmethionine:tRNA-ribosyltransferase-isomerase (queuine synthetase)
MKTNKIKIGVEKVGRSGLTVSEFDRTVTLKRGMKVAVVGTTTVGVVEKINGDEVTFQSDCDVTVTEKAKFLRAVL